CVFSLFSSRRRHTRSKRDWSSDVCSSDLAIVDIGSTGDNAVTTAFDGKVAFVIGEHGNGGRNLGCCLGEEDAARAEDFSRSWRRSEERRVGKERGWL